LPKYFENTRYVGPVNTCASCSLFYKKVEVSYALIKMATKRLQKGERILEFTYLETVYT